ncbi:cytosine/adenosine deaminase-related metal-dependent hydrolase [Geomicrobium halophilum]|uniref:Cytosine/adenosine deaminase-related metal-dependent hydrolase n=1 Tax=Geomicrobium halophilum TaxID=549000 RepID=A0A841PUJ4_9BACL|nr:amidohydrolase family protein [Geomicrobium halophilum]MBB6450816.1 cytosine/adenosine deaminase-related metal-dependent hydrolase [Geomicrobium halophilum]
MAKKLFKDGIVITLDKEIGNFNKADVLVEGSKIVEVKPNIEIGFDDCEIIDASNMIVMPGLVDSHRHTWESIIRNVGADWSLQTYLGSIYYGNIGSQRRPQDDYVGNLLGALEALESGVTTLLDWTMIISPDHTEEMIRGLKESGVRAVFAHGSPGDAEYWDQASEIDNTDEARRIKEKHFSSRDQLLTMGMAIRGPEFSSWKTTVKEIEVARELDAVCSMHLGFGTWGSTERSIEKLDQAGLLGRDLNFTHANAISPEEMQMLAAKGGSISVTPEVEMMMGHGYPATGLSIENGVKPTLGVDVVTSTGGDMFTQMKFALQAERARVNQKTLSEGIMPGPELHISAEEILESATIEGAKALMLEDKIGTLTPGKDADMIMIRATDLNIVPVNDPVGTVTQCTHTGNVDSVYVAGNAVKRHGRMLNTDLKRVRKLANEARDHIFNIYGNPVSNH